MNKKIEHSFSIELKTENGVKSMICQEGTQNLVFFEGNLGKLNDISMVEDVMLEIKGTNGSLKLDITRKEIQTCLFPDKIKEVKP